MNPSYSLFLAISAFGDSKVHTDPDGQSGASLQSNTNLDNQGAINGQIGMNATANSATKNMTVNNGLQVNNGNEGTCKFFFEFGNHFVLIGYILSGNW